MLSKYPWLCSQSDKVRKCEDRTAAGLCIYRHSSRGTALLTPHCNGDCEVTETFGNCTYLNF